MIQLKHKNSSCFYYQNLKNALPYFSIKFFKMIRNIVLLVSLVLMMLSCKTKKQMASTVAVTDKTIAESTISTNNIKSHIYYLASNELKGRDTPSDGLDIAARYLSSSLLRYGVKTVNAPGVEDYFQKVPLVNEMPPSEGEFKFGEHSFPISDGFLMMRGGNTDLNADIVFANYGSEDDLKGLDVKGKIVAVLCGFEGQSNPQQWFFAMSKKRKAVKEKGGVALIEVYTSSQLPYNFLIQFFNSPSMKVDSSDGEAEFPHLWLNGGQTEAIGSLKSDKGLKGTLKVGGIKKEPVKTQNVIGWVEGTDPKLKNEYIIYSAHYDHVGIGRVVEGDSIYNGARDNSVGTVTVLSAAENIAKHPTKRSALFIFFTGEEKGLLGSAYYADNPVIPLNQVTYCFNSDNAGYNDTTRATIFGLERTDAEPLIAKACATFGLTATKDMMPEQGLFDRSDNVNFAKKGVPAPTFGMGLTAFDDEVNKYYHQPQDNPETLDYDYLTKFFKAYVYACRLIANTDQSVFWRKGDKYYEDGLKLYNMKEAKN